jgi:hypothetical protein
MVMAKRWPFRSSRASAASKLASASKWRPRSASGASNRSTCDGKWRAAAAVSGDKATVARVAPW